MDFKMTNPTANELFDAVAKFHHHFYNDEVRRPTESTSVCKVGEEVGELQGAINKLFPRIISEEEWADVIVTAFHHGMLCGYDFSRAFARAIEKMEEIKKTGVVASNGLVVRQEDLSPEETAQSYLNGIAIIGMG